MFHKHSPTTLILHYLSDQKEAGTAALEASGSSRPWLIGTGETLPGFYPINLGTNPKELDYSKEKKNQPGLNKLLIITHAARNVPQISGHFSYYFFLLFLSSIFHLEPTVPVTFHCIW